MHLGLLVLGVAVALAGIAMAGYGIPINEFSLGNTLILAGTVAISGGLIIVGLAVAVGELRRLGAGRGLHPESGAFHAADDEPDISANGRYSAGRLPYPAQSASSTRRDLQSADPQVAGAVPADDAYDEYPEQSLMGAGEPPVMSEMDDAPLSPRNGAPRNAPQPATEASASPSWLRRLSGRSDAAPKPAEQQPPPPQYPSPNRRPAPARSPSASGEPPAPASRQSGYPGGNADYPVQQATAQPVAILKSGVVDGMAYTLYTDGSIEADLAQGRLKFDSVDDLRAHLERTG